LIATYRVAIETAVLELAVESGQVCGARARPAGLSHLAIERIDQLLIAKFPNPSDEFFVSGLWRFY